MPNIFGLKNFTDKDDYNFSFGDNVDVYGRNAPQFDASDPQSALSSILQRKRKKREDEQTEAEKSISKTEDISGITDPEMRLNALMAQSMLPDPVETPDVLEVTDEGIGTSGKMFVPQKDGYVSEFDTSSVIDYSDTPKEQIKVFDPKTEVSNVIAEQKTMQVPNVIGQTETEVPTSRTPEIGERVVIPDDDPSELGSLPPEIGERVTIPDRDVPMDMIRAGETEDATDDEIDYAINNFTPEQEMLALNKMTDSERDRYWKRKYGKSLEK